MKKIAAMLLVLCVFVGVGSSVAQTAIVTRNVNLRPDHSTDNGPLEKLKPPARVMISALDSVNRELTGSSLHVTLRGGLIDGVSFAALGIPTVTLISEVPPFVLPRGMHTASDLPSRIDVASLDQVQELLLRFVRNTDVHGMTF